MLESCSFFWLYLSFLGPSSVCEQERNAGIEVIRAALLEGEASGEPATFDVAALKRRM